MRFEVGQSADEERPSLPGTGRGDHAGAKRRHGGWGCGQLDAAASAFGAFSFPVTAEWLPPPPTALRAVPPPRSGEGLASSAATPENGHA
jgi:hypothetical protein